MEVMYLVAAAVESSLKQRHDLRPRARILCVIENIGDGVQEEDFSPRRSATVG